MTFSDKITFLLNLSGATNAELARAAGIDPSQVSRLKGGTRNAPKRGNTMERIAEFFASKCTSEYQRTALADTLGEPSFKLGSVGRRDAELICTWLRTKTSETSRKLDRFMQELENYSDRDHRGEQPIKKAADERASGTIGSIYMGNDGRRAAADDFMDLLFEQKEPCELYISSDESPAWLEQDRRYSAHFTARVRKLTEHGYSIKRIAPSLTDSDSAIESLTRWLSTYMTGSMQSYYYPRLRDGVYRRTLIVAPGVAALVANSICQHDECGATYLTCEPCAVASYEQEFNDYISKCVPLTKSYIFEKNAQEYSESLIRFQDNGTSVMSKWQSMPCTTMPSAIVNELERTLTDPAERENVRNFRKIQTAFEDNLAEGLMCLEIIRPHTARQILAGEATMSPSIMLPNSEIRYTVGEYRLHLMRILTLLEKYPNYRVIVDDGDMPEYEMHVKDNHAALLVRTTKPFAVFDIMEQNTIAACQEYIMLMATRYGPSIVIQRRRTIEKLRALYEALE